MTDYMDRHTPNRARDQRVRIAAFTVGFTLATILVSYVTSARADEPQPVLKEQIVIHSDIVTLGDLFENAGDAANIAVFRAPDLGEEGAVSSSRVAAAAKRHGLFWPNPGEIEKIVVRRPSRVITVDEVRSIIKKHLLEEPGIEDAKLLKIAFDANATDLDVSAKNGEPVIVKQLDFNAISGHFRAIVGLRNDERSTYDRTFRGRASESVKITVPASTINRGDTIEAGDVKQILIPKNSIRPGYASADDQIIGFTAKRRLTEGGPVLQSDLELPKFVRKNALVEIIFQAPNLVLKSEGRALSDGSEGDTISVLNTQSKRTIQATIIGPALVTVGPSFASPGQRKPGSPTKYSNRTSYLVR